MSNREKQLLLIAANTLQLYWACNPDDYADPMREINKQLDEPFTEEELWLVQSTRPS